MYKILKVIEPKVDEYGRKGLYRLLIDNGKGGSYPADMNEHTYKVLQLKIKLMKKGIKENLIEDFADAVREEAEHEHRMNDGD
jgi:SOS response regulatory protein OraA/RecX